MAYRKALPGSTHELAFLCLLYVCASCKTEIHIRCGMERLKLFIILFCYSSVFFWRGWAWQSMLMGCYRYDLLESYCQAPCKNFGSCREIRTLLVARHMPGLRLLLPRQLYPVH
jgi:hypothetical protein